mmetsp:Transcript_24417/g.60778  ORF Transcript_24417/g.60778 Transcript_24417/m.60778 type:complete len:272 (-) Transcript_24417:243-1058(-)
MNALNMICRRRHLVRAIDRYEQEVPLGEGHCSSPGLPRCRRSFAQVDLAPFEVVIGGVDWIVLELRRHHMQIDTSLDVLRGGIPVAFEMAGGAKRSDHDQVLEALSVCSQIVIAATHLEVLRGTITPPAPTVLGYTSLLEVLPDCFVELVDRAPIMYGVVRKNLVALLHDPSNAGARRVACVAVPASLRLGPVHPCLPMAVYNHVVKCHRRRTPMLRLHRVVHINRWGHGKVRANPSAFPAYVLTDTQRAQPPGVRTPTCRCPTGWFVNVP